MTPKEKIDNCLARSSMDTCNGVFFSSTCDELSRAIVSSNFTHVLHHGEDDAKLSILAGPDNDSRTIT
jgi:hypothetical protein